MRSIKNVPFIFIYFFNPGLTVYTWVIKLPLLHLKTKLSGYYRSEISKKNNI